MDLFIIGPLLANVHSSCRRRGPGTACTATHVLLEARCYKGPGLMLRLSRLAKAAQNSQACASAVMMQPRLLSSRRSCAGSGSAETDCRTWENSVEWDSVLVNAVSYALCSLVLQQTLQQLTFALLHWNDIFSDTTKQFLVWLLGKCLELD